MARCRRARLFRDPRIELALGLLFGNALALLQAPDKLSAFAVNKGKIVVGELAPFRL
jgi:hypothetical protein